MSDQFVGVDVGGTKIAVAVLEGGELSESGIVSTEHASQEVLVDAGLFRVRLNAVNRNNFAHRTICAG